MTVYASDVSCRLGGVTALANFACEIPAGRSAALTGPSGSGKTTALRAMGALLTHSSGTIAVDGDRLEGMTEGERTRFRARKTGFIYQNYNLLPYLTAAQNVEVASLMNRGGIPALDALESVGLKARANHLPAELSGGEQQRVGIARAISSRPVLLLADEPTGALDARTRDTVMNVLFDVQAHYGITLVVATHDHDVASRLDSEIRLEQGFVCD